MSAAAADELLSDDVLKELLCSDDWQYLWSWWGWFDDVTYIPAGSQVEGGYLARNTTDHTVWEEERDQMRVMACIRSPDDGVLVDVGEEHVHVRCPHTGIYIIPGRWERWVKESCISPPAAHTHVIRSLWEWVRSSCTSLPAGDTHTHRYINGRKLLQEYLSVELGEHVQGPSAAWNFTPHREPSGEVRELDRRISEWSETLTRYGCTLPVTTTTCLTQLYHCARDMREWLTDNGLTHGRYRVRMVSQELLDSLSSSDQSQGSTSEEGQVRQLLMSHLVRGVEIMKMCRTHQTHNTISWNRVPAIECLFWPRQAEAWINRRRLWPPQQVIEQVVSQGFHLVSKQRHINPSECDFRISFALSEQIIARSRCDGQKKAYYILNMIYYRYLKCIGPSDDDSLKSYACKTVMLWVCEQHAATWWEENSTLTTVTCLLTHLRECLVKREMKYYFIPEVNLFNGWNTSPAVLEECAGKISGLLDGNSLHETLCGDNFYILAHRLLVRGSGYKPLDVEWLVSKYGKMKTRIVELLSVYCDVAQSVILPSALDHTEDTDTLMDTLRELVRTVRGEQASTSMGGTPKPLCERITTEGSYSKRISDAWRAGRAGVDGLLGSVLTFVDGIFATRKSDGDEADCTVRDMSRYVRQIINILCAPHILLEARCLSDKMGVRYKSLDGRRVITHFISVIQGAMRAEGICEQHLDECISKLEKYDRSYVYNML